MTPILLSGATAVLIAYITLLIRRDVGCHDHRVPPSEGERRLTPWEIIARIEHDTSGWIISAAPRRMERGGYRSKHTVAAVQATGEVPVMARPRWAPAATRFSHNPPLAITAG